MNIRFSIIISWHLSLFELAIAYNPYTAWTIAYHEIFREALDHFELLGPAYQLPPGSVEEAILFFHGADSYSYSHTCL